MGQESDIMQAENGLGQNTMFILWGRLESLSGSTGVSTLMKGLLHDCTYMGNSHLTDLILQHLSCYSKMSLVPYINRCLKL